MILTHRFPVCATETPGMQTRFPVCATETPGNKYKGGVNMATKSFLKTVNLQGRRQCQDFIRAVERSQQHSAEKSQHAADSEPIKARDLTPEQIRKIFHEKTPIEDALCYDSVAER